MFRYKELSTLRKLILFKKLIASGIKVVRGAIASFVMKRAGKAISVLDSIEPIQKGSGTPSPTNIRPISGHTEVVTSRCGENVWDEEWELGGYNPSTGEKASYTNRIRCKNPIPIVPDTSYYFARPTMSSDAYNVVCWYDANGNYISGASTRAVEITAPSNARYMAFNVASQYGTTYNNDISINYPSTDHDYHAYNGTSYTTDLGRTVYGGTLDVVSGVLTVDRAMVDLGTLTWLYNLGLFRATVPNFAEPSSYTDRRNGFICSDFSADTQISISSEAMTDKTALRLGGLLYVKDTSYTDTTDFKTAMDGVQLVYELATPQTYQLTPQEVELILGQNNLWCDSGDIEVTYKG